MICILLLDGIATTDLIFVVFDNNVLMCVENMLATFTIFFRMQLTHKTYSSDERVLIYNLKLKRKMINVGYV